MKIIFDGLEYVLPLVSGTNPKFSFDQVIVKDLKYDQLETRYLEVILYSLPSSFDLYNSGGGKEKLLEKASVYSTYKVDLLTIIVGPEFHNIVLSSPKKKFHHLGRVMYTIASKQLSNINVKISSVKIKLNGLIQNDIALKLKYKDNYINPSNNYTSIINPHLLQKEKITEYDYKPENKVTNPLKINTKASMFDLTQSDSSLNIYSIRLINKAEEVKSKDYMYQQGMELQNSNSNIKLINHYNMMGYAILSFIEILSENDEALVKQSSQFFRHVSGFNKQDENNNQQGTCQTFIFQVFQDVNRVYTTPLYYEGIEIGSCDIEIEMNNVPLIRQIMCGVMTENGFEINSIHLYDNILSGDGKSLPTEVNSLINTKRNLNNELIKQKQIQSNSNYEFNLTILGYLKEFKRILSKTIEQDCLYYGYSENKDLYSGQNVMLDLGLILLNIIDKLNKDQRGLVYDILKLINERSEFDIGTISTKWFTDKKENQNIVNYYFADDSLLKNKIIENFLDFNLNCLKYSLEIITKGKIIYPQSQDFAEFFIRVAYFRIPIFRQALLESISIGVTEKIEEFIVRRRKLDSNKSKSVNEFIELDPINSTLLWEQLFYTKLTSAIEDNNKNKKIENEIENKMKNIKDFIESNNKQNNNTNINNNLADDDKENNDWRVLFSKRNQLFFDLIKNLVNKIYSKAETTKEINWLNIPGFTSLLNATIHEIKIRHVKAYPPQLKEIFKLFVNFPEIPNVLIKQVVLKTNLYDVPGIFNLLDIINSLFDEHATLYPDSLYLKFNYNLLNQVVKLLFKADHSLCVSKVLLLYYNCAHLMPVSHIGEICQSLYFSKFYNYFFHWSFEVRDKFYYFILFIIGHRLRETRPFQDIEDLKFIKNTATTEYVGVNLHKSFGDILDIKFGLIKELQNIIAVEHSDPTFNNVINKDKYGNVLKQIPEEVHKNIVVSLHHYEKIYEEFKEFKNDNKGKKIKDIEYPKLVLIPPKDDYIEYEK